MWFCVIRRENKLKKIIFLVLLTQSESKEHSAREREREKENYTSVQVLNNEKKMMLASRY